MLKQFNNNPNSEILKKIIQKTARTVQDKVFRIYTSSYDGEIVKYHWENQMRIDDFTKNRIVKITDQKLQEVLNEMNGEIGSLRKGSGRGFNLKDLGINMEQFEKSYFQRNQHQTRQASEKLKAIQQQQSRLKEKVEESKKRQMERRKEEEELQLEIKQTLEAEKKRKYKQYVLSSIKSKSLAKQERKKQNEKFDEFMKAYKSVKPLHVLMEEEYRNKFELPMLEESKKRLSEIKHKVKPSLQQLDEHDSRYMQLRQKHEPKVYHANKTIDVSFKSKFYLDEEEKHNHKQQQGPNMVFDQVEKQKKYSELVKEHFKPRVSMKLRESMNESTMRSSSVKESLNRSQQVERGKQYLQFMKSLQKNRNPKSIGTMEDKQESQRYTNYLVQLKRSRSIQRNESEMFIDWQKDAKNLNLSEVERRERILMKSKQLEQKAQRQQKIINVGNFTKAEQVIEMKKQIDDTLISSIMAKMTVLKETKEL